MKQAAARVVVQGFGWVGGLGDGGQLAGMRDGWGWSAMDLCLGKVEEEELFLLLSLAVEGVAVCQAWQEFQGC